MEPKIARYFFIVLCACVFSFGCSRFLRAFEEPNVVRVAVLTDITTFDLSVRGKYQVIDPKTEGVIDEGRRLDRSLVSVTPKGIAVGRREYGIDRLRVVAKEDVSIYSGGKIRRYRDRIDIILTPKKDLLVINALGLESYVRGVLYHEMPHRWPMDAIKVQAVATRTYALYQMLQKKNQLYDVTSGIYSQVYGGRSAERYRPNIAVKRTRGEILVYDGKVLPAYFHSNCGGHTEDAGALWKHDLPPLHGGVCGFCKGMPNYTWKKNFRSKDIQEKLNASGYKIGLIKDIAVVGRTKSGRIKDLKITARDGNTVTVPGRKFRDIIGPNVIKSNLYEVDMQGYYFDLNGRGWGHGVGMCQWGAYQMAEKRYSYTNILKHYYPGAKIVKISEL